MNIPIKVTWTEGSGKADIEIQGTRLSLKAGEWSAWVPVTFPFNFLVKAKGILQFHVIRADRELQIYASPVNLDPRDPPIPISNPEEFSKKLAGRHRPLPHHRLGGGHVAAERRAHGRGDVPVRRGAGL